MRTKFHLLRTGLVLGLIHSAWAQPVITQQATAFAESGRPQRLESPDAVPEGLSAPDWSSIRQQYEQHRHAAVPVEGAPETLQARNPGQQWQTRFDGRGFTVTPESKLAERGVYAASTCDGAETVKRSEDRAPSPDAGGWQWGLELRSYGFTGHERVVGGRPRVSTAGQRVAYDWDDTLQEWFINDARGLEHGFTVHQRPSKPSTLNSQPSTPLTFTLAVRGGLRPEVQADGRGVRFVDAHGAAALTYAGLTVLDADGRKLSARFEPVEGRAGCPQPAASGNKTRLTPRRGEDTASHHKCEIRLSIDERDARYPLTIDPIAQQAYLKASNTETYDRFGYSVAVSGDTVVIGAPVESSNATGVNGNQNDNSAPGSGAAYVFVRSGTTWSQQAYLKASNTEAGDYFGHSVSVSGDTVVVGALWEPSKATGVNGNQSDNSAFRAGAAYVFVRSGTTWSQQAYLKASNSGANDQFGESVAVSGDMVVVGAPGESSNATGVNGNQSDNNAPNSGAAYVFVRNGATWSQQAYLKASNTEQYYGFGSSVSVSGDTVVVGAPGESSNATGVNGNQSDNNAPNSGAAYVFVRSGTNWVQQAYLKASNSGTYDLFGGSVAVSGDAVVVGALWESSNATGVNGNQDDNSAGHSGAAYVFVRSETTWSQQAYLKASNTGVDDIFGNRVSVSGDTVVVGAYVEDSNATGVNDNQSDNNALNSGAAYVFVRSGTNWVQQAYLKASNSGAVDEFGWSVAVSGDTVVVGAVNESSSATGVNGAQCDNSASESGAAYVFDLNSNIIVIVGPEIAVEQPLGTGLSEGSATVDFTSGMACGISKRTFTIRNTGNADLTGLGITITGPNASDFTVTTRPAASLSGPCGSTTFTVTFSPGAAGTRTATLHIASNDSDESPFDITLTWTGPAPAREIAVEQPSGTDLSDGSSVVEFGNGLVGSSSERTFTIRNTGYTDLAGLGLTIAGPNADDFTVIAHPTEPVSGPCGSTTFTVAFSPGALGIRTAELHIASNDSDESPFDITLTGTGLTPDQNAQAYSVVVLWGSVQTTVPLEAQSGVRAIAAGTSHAVALKDSGRVVTWRVNDGLDYGQTTVPVAAQSGVTAIAAGWDHTVALKNSSSVVAWGANYSGQANVPVAAQSGVRAIAAGGAHTVALKSDGSVVAWGWNGNGQTTVPLAAQSGVTAVAAGGFHTVALKNDGSVVTWGFNGDGLTNVPVAAQSGVKAIAAGRSHTAALKNDGSVVAWGYGGQGQTTVPAELRDLTAIAAGQYHTAALKNDGTVVAWGYEAAVPAGLGAVKAIAAADRYTMALLSPTRVQFAAVDYSVTENGGALSLTVQRLGDLSGTHTIDYATQDGSAAAGVHYTARSGTLTFAPGQTTQTVFIPILNDGVPESNALFQVLLNNLTGFQALLGMPATSTVTILDNDTGFQFSAAHYSVWETVGTATITVLRGNDLNSAVTVDYATSDGSATAGADYTARSGTLHFAAGETTQTILIPILDDGLDEGSETLHLTLTNPSAGVSLGANRDAVLAILDDERPLNIDRNELKTIAAGLGHTLVLKSDGSLWAWGNDYWGQLGDGANETNRTVPVRVGTDTDWTALAAGDYHTVALKADGSLWAWGANWAGQLGDGTTANRHRPARIGADRDWSAIAAGPASGEGQNITLALKTDGSLWAWGSDWSQTGPVRIGTGNDWTTIALALNGLALKTDGSLWELPYRFGMPPAPQHVGTDNDWFTVTAGGDDDWNNVSHNVALKTDGSLWVWSSGWSQTPPVPIGSDHDWAAITAGPSYSAALKQDGSLWTWGVNWSGQLGNGTTEGTNRPVRLGSNNDWVRVAAGSAHTVALQATGSLWTWGANGSGQLGIGTTEGTNIPVRVGTDTDWALPALPASEFGITSHAVGGDGRFRLSFTTTNSRSYFILYRGPEVTNIHQSVDATLGPFVFQLSDPTPVSSNATAFYRIRAVPFAQPLDLDADGIDDGYELRHRTFLNPFNPADAALDFDGDGQSNLQEYRDGTDPATPP